MKKVNIIDENGNLIDTGLEAWTIEDMLPTYRPHGKSVGQLLADTGAAMYAVATAPEHIRERMSWTYEYGIYAREWAKGQTLEQRLIMADILKTILGHARWAISLEGIKKWQTFIDDARKDFLNSRQ